MSRNRRIGKLGLAIMSVCAVFTGRTALASDTVYENAVRIQMQAVSAKADVAIWLNCEGESNGLFSPTICGQGFPWPGPAQWLELKGLPVKLSSLAFRLKYMEKTSGEKLSELTMGRVFGTPSRLSPQYLRSGAYPPSVG